MALSLCLSSPSLSRSLAVPLSLLPGSRFDNWSKLCAKICTVKPGLVQWTGCQFSVFFNMIPETNNTLWWSFYQDGPPTLPYIQIRLIWKAQGQRSNCLWFYSHTLIHIHLNRVLNLSVPKICLYRCKLGLTCLLELSSVIKTIAD